MIKKILLGMTLLMSMVACTEDYTDWGKPQTSSPEEAVAFGDNGSISGVQAINLADVTTPTVKVANIVAPTGGSGYKASEFQLTLGGASLSMNEAGEVSTEDLQNVIVTNYGKAPQQREFTAKALAWISNGHNSVKIESGSITVQATPKAANIEQVYYLAGDIFADGYNKDVVKTHAFDHSDNNVWDDPNFSIEVKTTEANKSFMIIPASSLEKSDIRDGAFGSGSKKETLESNSGKAITIEKAGKYIITVNMEALTYKVKRVPSLFLTGSEYNWGKTESDWKQLIQYNGSKETYWTMIYFSEGEQFKFAPQADWGDEFGDQATIEDNAGAGIVSAGGKDHNLKVGKAGWYLLRVTNGNERKLEVCKPEVYLVGDVIAGGWGAGWEDNAKTDANKFTAPTTKDGLFVSPEFANSGNLRMYVNFPDTGYKDPNNNWWKAEFNVIGGDIVFRGNGGDLQNVAVEANHQVELNFTTGKGEIK